MGSEEIGRNCFILFWQVLPTVAHFRTLKRLLQSRTVTIAQIFNLNRRRFPSYRAIVQETTTSWP